MDSTARPDGSPVPSDDAQLLQTLDQLLAVEALDLPGALNQVSDALAATLRADKIDIFLLDPATDTLVALGTSATPMGRQQHASGLDKVPLANRGRMVEVFETGVPHLTGRAEEDPEIPVGYRETLGIRSMINVPLEVAGERRGLLQAASSQPDHFTERDLRFLGSVARWVGMVAHRAELVETLAAELAEQARRGAADELVTVLAHDFRGPLQVVVGRIGLLAQRARREGHARNLDDAEAAIRAARRLDWMISDLLDVSRLERGLWAVERQPVELGALAEEVARTLAAPGVAVDVRADGEALAWVDAARLRQALENLVGNALEHSPDGVPIEVLVTTEARDDGEWAIVAVRDKGPGIPAELLPRLFERFAAGPGSRGLGLGLYLARQIAEVHGGTLTAEGAPGAGAHFTLALPAGRPPGAADI